MSEWIPITDALPADHARVIAAWGGGEEGTVTETMYFAKLDSWLALVSQRLCDERGWRVTHWCPMPRHPLRKEQED